MRARTAGYEKVATDELGGTSSASADSKLPEYTSSSQRRAQAKPFKMADYKVDDQGYELIINQVPWASIRLAILLMLIGMTCLCLAWMHFTQAILGKPQAEVGFSVIGLLTFIPGFYHCRIAYYTWRGRPGFQWDSIPAW